MKIQKITQRSRRDFWATMECEHCGKEFKLYGDEEEELENKGKIKVECPYCGKKTVCEYEDDEDE